jgi:FkbM family methyltransferase
MTRGRFPDHFYCKFVPNPYQYRRPTFRLIDRNGIRMRVDISDYIGHYYFYGFKQLAEESLFSLCGKHAQVLDVGANIGTTLLRLAQNAYEGKVVGFEPDPINFLSCSQNLSLNDFSHARVVNFGLGSEEASVDLETRSFGNRGGNRISTSDSPTGVKVRIRKLDNIFPELRMERLDLIKIDVEGYELRVLKGGAKVIGTFRPILFIEVDDNNLLDQGDSAALLFTFLLDLGYRSIVYADTLQPIAVDDDFSHCHFDVIVR